MPVFLVFALFDLASFNDAFIEFIHLSLLSFDLSLQVSQESILLRDGFSVDAKDDIETSQPLLQLHLIAKEDVVVFFLGVQLELNVLISCLDHLIIGEELFDFSRLLPVKFVHKAFVGDFFLSFELGLQLFVLGVSQLLLFTKLVALVVELLGHLCKRLDLNVKELDLHLSFFDFLAELSRLLQSILIVCLCEEVVFNLRKVTVETILF